MIPKDWALLVIASARGEQLSPVQLQKALFLIGRNLTPQQRCGRDFYNFRAYDYGPFDSSIYNDAVRAQAEGFVRIIDPLQSHRAYSATELGLFEAQRLRAGLA